MNRIHYKTLGVSTFALRKPTETPAQALRRSVSRLAGVGDVRIAPTGTRTADGNSIELHVNVLGRQCDRKRGGGWPVLAEFRVFVAAL